MEDILKTSFIKGLPELPLVVEPNGDASMTALMQDIDTKRTWFDSQLLKYGAILLRGYEVRTPEEFQAISQKFAPKFVDYTRGASPRTKVSGAVYTSTDAPPFAPIPLHCELSYIDEPPDRIFFFCHTPAEEGGETPIADMRAVYAAIDPGIRQKFETRGIRIIQNVPSRVTQRKALRAWQDMFTTDDPHEVERLCDRMSIEWKWKPDGTLRLINTRPATIRHPVTGDPIWFNSANNMHDSWSWEFYRSNNKIVSVFAGMLEWGRRLLKTPVEDYPLHCTYGDGTEISRDEIIHVRQVLWDHAVVYPWMQGDVIVIDNLRVAHARMPFRGKGRRILVAMGATQQVIPGGTP